MVSTPPRETCAMCPAPGTSGALFFVAQVGGRTVEVRVVICDDHAEKVLKHLKRIIPVSLMEGVRR